MEQPRHRHGGAGDHGPEGQMERPSAVNMLEAAPEQPYPALDRIVSKEHCVVRAARRPLGAARDLGSPNGTLRQRPARRGRGGAPPRRPDHARRHARGLPRPAGVRSPARIPPRPRCRRPSRAGGGAVIAPALPVVSPAQIEPAAPLRRRAAAPRARARRGDHAGPRPPAAPQRDHRRRAMMESHVRSKIAAGCSSSSRAVGAGRRRVWRDYEKLRISYELQRSVGAGSTSTG